MLDGEQDDFTFGLNWYPNPNIRLMANYVKVLDIGAGNSRAHRPTSSISAPRLTGSPGGSRSAGRLPRLCSNLRLRPTLTGGAFFRAFRRLRSLPGSEESGLRGASSEGSWRLRAHRFDLSQISSSNQALLRSRSWER
ncbi:MAG: porin [Pseudomonadota bacterium]|nr:porin [Pseudomonadota bacterium]